MGFDLISANNGWAMAATGALIVLIGLAALSFIISQLHKVIALFEKRTAEPPPKAERTAEPTDIQLEPDMLNNLPAAAKMVKRLSADLGSHFELSVLHQRMRQDQIPHPHLTIRSLREAGLLVPAGNGTFTWQNV